NTDVTTGSGIPAGFTTNSLRFSSAVTAVLSGTNTIQSGGIVVASFGGVATMTGGTLASGTGELIVHTHSDLTINSSLDLPGGLTKNGVFYLKLGGQTSWHAGAPLTINYGYVTFTNPLAFDTLTNVRFNSFSGAQILGFELPTGQ